MLKTEYDLLAVPAQKAVPVRGNMLAYRVPRTLIYGYTLNRDTFHVYLGADGKIHKVIYAPSGGSDVELLAHASEDEIFDLAEYVPSKRIYPAASDYNFCLLLQKAGVHLPFTTFEARPITSGWYGLRLEELQTSKARAVA